MAVEALLAAKIRSEASPTEAEFLQSCAELRGPFEKQVPAEANEAAAPLRAAERETEVKNSFLCPEWLRAMDDARPCVLIGCVRRMMLVPVF
eukprot:3363928-Pyramimonas_sp.AAC.4